MSLKSLKVELGKVGGEGGVDRIPPPPAGAGSASGSFGAWKQTQDAQGKTFWYNSETKATSWTNPVQNQTAAARAYSEWLSKHVEGQDESEPLLVAELEFQDKVPQYDSRQGKVERAHIVRTLQIHENNLLFKQIQSIKAQLQADAEAQKQLQTTESTQESGGTVMNAIQQDLPLPPGWVRKEGHDGKTYYEDPMGLRHDEAPIATPTGPMTRKMMEDQLKLLENKAKTLPTEQTIQFKHGELIERMLQVDGLNHLQAQKNMLLKTGHIQKVIEALDQDYITSMDTVGFLNVPRQDDWHEGSGFMLLTKEKNGDAMYLHMYEYDVQATMVSQQSRQYTTSTSSWVNGSNQESTTKRDMKQTMSDDTHRLTHGMYGTLAVRDILSTYQFSIGDTRRTETTEAHYTYQNTQSVHAQECDCCGDCQTQCPAFSCCVLDLKCWGECKPCCDCEPPKVSYNYSSAGNTLDEKVSAIMNTKLDDLITHGYKKNEIAQFESQSPLPNDPQVFELKGKKKTNEQHKHYVGIEFTYLDHRTRTQELGVVLFEPDSEFMDILTTVGKINSNIDRRHSDFAKMTDRYEIGEKDPFAILGLREKRSNMKAAKPASFIPQVFADNASIASAFSFNTTWNVKPTSTFTIPVFNLYAVVALVAIVVCIISLMDIAGTGPGSVPNQDSGHTQCSGEVNSTAYAMVVGIGQMIYRLYNSFVFAKSTSKLTDNTRRVEYLTVFMNIIAAIVIGQSKCAIVSTNTTSYYNQFSGENLNYQTAQVSPYSNNSLYPVIMQILFSVYSMLVGNHQNAEDKKTGGLGDAVSSLTSMLGGAEAV